MFQIDLEPRKFSASKSCLLQGCGQMNLYPRNSILENKIHEMFSLSNPQKI